MTCQSRDFFKIADISDLEENLLCLPLLRRHRRRLRAACRTRWTRRWVLKREDLGAFSNLIQELNAEDPEKFRQFHRLDRQSFNDVLARVGPYIVRENTNMRSSISPDERLSITLRFLATGETFRSLSFQFRMGERTISGIVDETCQALYTVLKGEFMQTPTSEEEWLKVAQEFQKKWNYPCCIGAIDGKHIKIHQPAASGSQFFNYKHYFSVLLLAVVNANYSFIYVDVGAPGRAGDAGVFYDSTLKNALHGNSLNLPPHDNIASISQPINHHLVGDDAFAMTNNLMKPYPHRNLVPDKRIFNYRLSRARRVVENAFGILANRFRVFLTTINLSPEKTTNLILATCCLHNYMVEKNKHTYISVCDIEDIRNQNFKQGAWRHDPALIGLPPSSERNPAKSARTQRELLTDYFSSESGSVPWQYYMVSL